MADTTDRSMYPHRIRLVGPWDAEPFGGGRSSSLSSVRRVVVPVRLEDLGLANEAGILFRRRFGLPRKLDDWERVWVVPSWETDIAFMWQLNGTDVKWTRQRDEGPSDYVVPSRSDVTALLRDRNELTVRILAAGPHTPPFGGAALDIGCRAYIQRVRIRSFPNVVAREVVLDVSVFSEDSNDRLEIYVLVDGVNCGYLKPHECGNEKTHIVRWDEPIMESAVPFTLRVDLVNVATIWDTVEMRMSFPE
jgi:hypothetical protein